MNSLSFVILKTHSLNIVILIGPDGNSTLKSRRHGHIVFSPVSFSHTWSVTSHCAKMNDEAAGKKKKENKEKHQISSSI